MFIAVGVQKLVRSKKQSKGSVIILDLYPKNHIANSPIVGKIKAFAKRI